MSAVKYEDLKNSSGYASLGGLRIGRSIDLVVSEYISESRREGVHPWLILRCLWGIKLLSFSLRPHQ